MPELYRESSWLQPGADAGAAAQEIWRAGALPSEAPALYPPLANNPGEPICTGRLLRLDCQRRIRMTHTRRQFLKPLATGAAALAAPGLAGAASTLLLPGDRPARRPNILFALADDWMWPKASIGGDKVIQTPTFDRWARAGVMFTNAFVSAPSCSPSRAAMLCASSPLPARCQPL